MSKEAGAEGATGTEGTEGATGTEGKEGTEGSAENLGDAGKKALDAEREARGKSDKRVKELEKELAAIRTSSLSDSEKAIEAAKAEVRAEVTTATGARLARSEFVAAAAKQNPEFDVTKILDDLNLSKYVGDDGEPDVPAIAEAVKRLIPASEQKPGLQLDLGGRPLSSSQKGKGMSDLIREGAGRG